MIIGKARVHFGERALTVSGVDAIDDSDGLPYVFVARYDRIVSASIEPIWGLGLAVRVEGGHGVSAIPGESAAEARTALLRDQLAELTRRMEACR